MGGGKYAQREPGILSLKGIWEDGYGMLIGLSWLAVDAIVKKKSEAKVCIINKMLKIRCRKPSLKDVV